jgi:hypothetical protein
MLTRRGVHRVVAAQADMSVASSALAAVAHWAVAEVESLVCCAVDL